MKEDSNVLGVLDGDTIVLEGKTRFRLRLIDAPELGNCGGDEAKKELEKLVKGQKVRVEETIIDLKGRPMGLVYIGEKLVNLEMIKNGWARYHYDKTSKSEEIKQVANEVKTQKRGLFGICRFETNPINPNCNIKGNIDPSNSKNKIYFVPGCVQYKTAAVELDRGEEWFCTEVEAQTKGYRKSTRCP